MIELHLIESISVLALICMFGFAIGVLVGIYLRGD